jgi:hypothetical protein
VNNLKIRAVISVPDAADKSQYGSFKMQTKISLQGGKEHDEVGKRSTQDGAVPEQMEGEEHNGGEELLPRDKASEDHDAKDNHDDDRRAGPTPSNGSNQTEWQK